MTKVVRQAIKDRRDDLNNSLIHQGIIENRYRIQELDLLLDDETLIDLIDEDTQNAL